MLFITPGMTNSSPCKEVMNLLIWECVMGQAPVWQPMGTLFHMHLWYQIQWRHCLHIYVYIYIFMVPDISIDMHPHESMISPNCVICACGFCYSL